MPPSWLALSLLLALSTPASSVTFECEHVRTNGRSWHFQALKGPKEVHHQVQKTENIHNTTYTIDICDKLSPLDDVPKKDQCMDGTRICAIDRVYHNDGTVEIEDTRNIAGHYVLNNGKTIDPKFERLKDSENSEDADKEGVRIFLHGGKHLRKEQMAIIDFICDPELTGNEGFEDTKQLMQLETRAMNASGEADVVISQDDGDSAGDDDTGLPNLDKGKSLQFERFEIGEKVDTLRLTWRTKYACESEEDEDDDGGDGDSGDDNRVDKSRGWGFFTWFIIVLFLLIAAYIIFGSWLNYNRYGARGWDLIPHGDFIRDLPYILKDFGGNIMDRLRGMGGGSRGGYSAV